MFRTPVNWKTSYNFCKCSSRRNYKWNYEKKANNIARKIINFRKEYLEKFYEFEKSEIFNKADVILISDDYQPEELEGLEEFIDL